MTHLKFRAYHHKMKKMLTVRCIDFHNKSFDCIDGDECFLVKFEDCEIMQSTGLTDKNGKEIFEGDIIKNNKGKIYEIQFLYGAFYAYTIKIDTNKDNGKSLYLLEDIVDVSEIIGNIYENPELLNK